MDISKVQDKNQIADAKLRSTSDVKGGKTPATKDVAAGEIGAAPRTQNSEKVSWSPDASLAMEALDTARNAPDARAEKVAQLKAQIKNGTYKTDATKIADKMIEKSLEEDLLTRRST